MATGGGGMATGGGGMATGGGGMATGGVAGSGGMAPVAVCGNGVLQAGETCDDANTMEDDGCSAACVLESGFECLVVGQSCVKLCGDGVLKGAEQCDDSNALSFDGCSNQCQIEAGFRCLTLGMPCTNVCADGLVVRGELCDDNNTADGDGCSADCKTVAPGFICDIPGGACRQAPNCPGGVCVSECGDGLKFDAEACDDGNLVDGDGCSASCTIEAGYLCPVVTAELPAQLAVPVTLRDFISAPAADGVKHPDFNAFSGVGITPGMVEADLGVDGLPVYTGVCEVAGPNVANLLTCPFGAQSTSAANFDQWYRDAAGVNVALPDVLVMNRQGATGTYVFDSGQGFFPMTGRGWDKLGKEAIANGANYGFTTVLRYWFRHQGDEVLEFSGDDDVWVFIGGRLAVDVGGIHPKQSGSVTLNAAFGLTVGNTYEIALFQAERRPTGSNYKLTFTGFENSISACMMNPL
jgi:fibro-slime domain-containing protein